MMGSLAILVISMNLALFLSIYCFSALIGHFKKRYRTREKTQYEFASLFRRFVAFFLDTLFLLLPPVVAIALFLTVHDFPRDPLRIMLTLASMLGFSVIGGFLYHSLLEGLFGATLGKKICGIIVLKADFTRADSEQGASGTSCVSLTLSFIISWLRSRWLRRSSGSGSETWRPGPS
jgi:hypothetical protein